MNPTTDSSFPADPVQTAEWLTSFIESGDQLALQQLIEQHASLVMSTCNQILKNQHDAEEAFQATFMALVNKAESIENPKCLSVWLYRVAHRAALDLRRARNGKRTEPLREEKPVPNQQETKVEQTEELTILHEELDQLPDQLRTPLVLCYLEGHTRQQAADALETTDAAVKSLLTRGRELLQKRLVKRGIALTSVLAAWQTTQVQSAILTTSAIVQQTMTSCVAQQTVSTTGMLKGSSWMTVLAGKKVLATVVGIALLAGGGLVFNQEKEEPPAVSVEEKTPEHQEVILESDPDKLLKQVLAGLNARKKKYVSFSATGTVTESEYYKDNGLKPPTRLIEPDVTTLPIKFVVKPVFTRYEHGDMKVNSNPKPRLYVLNSQETRELVNFSKSPDSSKMYPRAYIYPRRYELEMVYNYNNFPIEWCFREVNFNQKIFSPDQIHKRQVYIKKKNDIVDDINCIVLRTSPGFNNFIDTYWISPERDFSVIRHTTSHEGRFSNRLKIDYSLSKSGHWLPTSWTARIFNLQTQTFKTKFEVKLSFDSINKEIPDGLFELNFPYGTVVQDQTFDRTKVYVQLEEGEQIPYHGNYNQIMKAAAERKAVRNKD